MMALDGVGMKLVGLGGAVVSGYGVFNNLSMPFLGVPLTVIGMAAAGAYLSFAYGKPEPNRKKLYALAIANTFLASVSVAVLPGMLGWDWAVPKIEAPLAGFFAFGSRWFIPAFIESVPEFVRKFLKLGDYKETK